MGRKESDQTKQKKASKAVEQLDQCPGPQIRVRNGKLFSYFSTKTYVVGTQKSRLTETVLLSTQNTCLN